MIFYKIKQIFFKKTDKHQETKKPQQTQQNKANHQLTYNSNDATDEEQYQSSQELTDAFLQNIQQEEKDWDSKNAEILQNSNIYQYNYINTMGTNFESTYMHNPMRSHLNTAIFASRVSDNFILTMFPFVIERLVKTNIIFKNIAEIPISDAFEGLSIKSTDPRVQDVIEDINVFLLRKISDIIYLAVDAEIFGGSMCVLAGDDLHLQQALQPIRDTNANEIVLASFMLKDCQIDAEKIQALKNARLHKNTDDIVKINDKQVNQDRCVLFCGSNVPHGSIYRKVMKGLSFSIFENLRSPLYGIILSIESADEMALKQSIDVLGYKGLAQQLKDANVLDRIKQKITGLINFTLKKLKTDDVLVTDADTKYERLSNNFNLSAMIEGIAKEYAFYTGIPVARLLGESGQNLAGTGVNANERRYTQLLSKIQQHYYSYLHTLISKIIYMKYGISDADFTIEFTPQIITSEGDKLDNLLKRAQIYQSLQQTGAMSIEEIREKLREDGLLSATADTSADAIIEDTDNSNEDDIK